MLEREQELPRALVALRQAHPELDPLAGLIVLALREFGWMGDEGTTTALLSRRLGIEHALIRRACAELEAADWIATQPVGGASPALRVMARALFK